MTGQHRHNRTDTGRLYASTTWGAGKGTDRAGNGKGEGYWHAIGNGCGFGRGGERDTGNGESNVARWTR
jgi:hypothetical protein